jgi:hypothetical protein
LKVAGGNRRRRELFVRKVMAVTPRIDQPAFLD